MKKFSASDIWAILTEFDQNMGTSDASSKMAEYERFGFYSNPVSGNDLMVKDFKGRNRKFQPFLAINESIDNIKKFPLVVMPKYDGIRCLVHPDMGVISRDFKRIPNQFINDMIEGYTHMDGEIVTLDGDGNIEDFETIQSKVMTVDGEPNFVFVVFDSFETLNENFIDRLAYAQEFLSFNENGFVKLTEYKIIENSTQLREYEQAAVDKGEEGIIVKPWDAPYKFGRSTLKEGYAFKIKRFIDDEALVLSINEATEGGTLGSITVRWKNHIFNIGNGWSHSQGYEIWVNRHNYKDKYIKFKYCGLTSKGIPKFTSFLAFREMGY